MAAPAPGSLVHAKQLLVEGKSAELFCGALAGHLGLTGIQLQNYGGITDLAGFLKALRNDPGFAGQIVSLGIVRDAETDATGALQSVCSALHGAGLPEPAQPMVATGSRPNVVVFLLPDCVHTGMLEDLCLQAVGGDPAAVCVDEYVKCLQRQRVALPSNLPKARLQAFLASRQRPGLLLGQAAQAGYFPWDHAAFNEIKQFLRAL